MGNRLKHTLKGRTNQSALWRWIVRPVPKLRLSHQLLGFFVIVVLFPLLLLSLSIYSINQRAVRKQVAHFTEHTAQATYQELKLEMAWQEEQARMSSEYWLAIPKIPSRKVQTQLISQFFNHYPDYEAVALYNAKGDRLDFYPSSHFLFKQFRHFPDHLEAIPDQATFEINYHTGKNEAHSLVHSLQITLPSPKWENSQVAAIRFQKRFPFLDQLIEERFKTFEHGFVIVDEHGIIIAGPPDLVSKTLPERDLQRYKALPEGIVKGFSAQTSFYHIPSAQSDDQDESPLEKVFIKVPHLHWGLIIESPYRIQLRYIMKARTQSVALVFLCILIIVILGLVYSQGINRNFRQLIKGIKALAEGRYSRKIRLITKSFTPYEIVYLTAEFNRMATKISSAWASIQKLNEELVYKNQQDLFISKATQRLHSSLELEEVCQQATQILTERPEVLATLLYLQNDMGKYELMAYAAQELLCQLNPEALNPLEESALNTLLENPPLGFLLDTNLSFIPPKTQAWVYPVSYQANTLGAILLIKPTPDQAEPSSGLQDGMLTRLIISQIGVAIHQAKQWKQLQIANIQLSQLDELKSNLIDTVSHELRTPLTNIKGYTSRLIRYEEALDSETKLKSLKVIKQQADRLGRLVEDLLVIPDLERKGGIRVFPDRVNLNELVNRCVLFVEEKANRDIQVSSIPEELDILVDPDRMEQVILNLLDNAIKYSYENSVIEVSVFEKGQQFVQIQVYNPCDPIPSEELATLFAKFKRLDERLTRTTRGTGLGLFITKGLIEAMGGSIWLEGHDGFRVYLEVPVFESNEKPWSNNTEVSHTI